MFPTLTLRMQGMEYSIVQVLHDHQQEIEAEVERQFKQILSPDSIKSMVRDAVTQTAKATLAEAVKSAVRKAMWSDQVRSALESDVHSALMKALNEYWPQDSQGGSIA